MSILSAAVEFGTALLSKKSNSKAIKQVEANASRNRTENNELAQTTLDQGVRSLSPYVNRGEGAASALYQRAMGQPPGGQPQGQGAGSGWRLDPATGQYVAPGGMVSVPPEVAAQMGVTGSPGAPGQGGQDWSAYLQANPDVMQWAQETVAAGAAPDLATAAQGHYQKHGQAEGRQVPTLAAQSQPSTPDQAGSSYGPQMGARTTYTRPDAGAAPTFNRPGETARPDPARPGDPTRASYTRPNYARTETPGFKFGMDEYVQTPGFNFQQERGMGALKSDKTFNGLLRSGAALKGALDFSQNLAMQDFTGERAFAYGQYSDDRNRQDNIFSQDRAFGTGAFESDRAYGTGVFDTDRNRQDSIFAGDRQRQDNIFDTDRNRRDGIFESDRGYGTDLFLANRNFTNSNFNSDREYGTGIYDSDRDYATSRFDSQNSLLAGFADQGYSATGAQNSLRGANYTARAGNNDAYYGTMNDAALGKAANRNALYAAGGRAYANVEDSFANALTAGASGGAGGGASSYMATAGQNYLNRAARPSSYSPSIQPVRF